VLLFRQGDSLRAKAEAGEAGGDEPSKTTGERGELLNAGDEGHD
jgi:hypothetical protein